jgi:hypothetical protein
MQRNVETESQRDKEGWKIERQKDNRYGKILKTTV